MGRIDNDAWQHRVWQGIRDGYGVEDIALQLGCDLDHVRREVSVLRLEGEIAKMFGGSE